MRLADLIGRPPPEPFEAGGKIPWDEPGFSARMLREHLSQLHDGASRRGERIDAHVQAIHQELLGGRPARVLDLGCGPGLYCSRLARLGHTCTGIDFSPAAIEYASREAEREGLDCRYRCADLRGAELPGPFDLALLVYGELDTFPRQDAQQLLRRVHSVLAPEGRVLLEVHPQEFVRDRALRPPTWMAAPAGLFSDAPHLCLFENAWSEAERAATERFTIVDTGSAGVESFCNTLWAMSGDERREMLRAAGFEVAQRYASFGTGVAPEPGLVVWLAEAAS